MQWFQPTIGAVFGLVIGSFLNVVIHRGPAMWGLVENDTPPRGNLLTPRSYCPHCRKPIPAWRNIPLLSYLLQRGRCSQCHTAISPRYPIVEFLGAVSGASAVILFGLTVSGVLAATFLWSLIALAAIDWETGYLPDVLTLPLILIGIIVNIGDRFIRLQDAVVGAIAGYFVFWGIAVIFKHVRGREGLGLGDAKLLAALGAWSGWAALAPTVFLGATLALLGVGAVYLVGTRIDGQTPIPFGPALAFSGALVFIGQAGGYLRFLAFDF